MEINEWIKTGSCIEEISLKASQPNLNKGLRNAIQNYVKIASSFEFKSTKLIDDNIEDIAYYVSQTSQFIENLIENHNASPPFQLDLLIAVKNVVDDGMSLCSHCVFAL